MKVEQEVETNLLSKKEMSISMKVLKTIELSQWDHIW